MDKEKISFDSLKESDICGELSEPDDDVDNVDFQNCEIIQSLYTGEQIIINNTIQQDELVVMGSNESEQSVFVESIIMQTDEDNIQNSEIQICADEQICANNVQPAGLIIENNGTEQSVVDVNGIIMQIDVVEDIQNSTIQICTDEQIIANNVQPIGLIVENDGTEQSIVDNNGIIMQTDKSRKKQRRPSTWKRNREKIERYVKHFNNFFHKKNNKPIIN